MRHSRRRPYKEYAIIGLLSLGVVWLSLQVFDIFRKEEVARHAAGEAKRDLKILEEREATLTANLSDLETERGAEASIRETFGVARPGEEVIIVVADSGSEEELDLPWWRRVFGWFGL